MIGNISVLHPITLKYRLKSSDQYYSDCNRYILIFNNFNIFWHFYIFEYHVKNQYIDQKYNKWIYFTYKSSRLYNIYVELIILILYSSVIDVSQFSDIWCSNPIVTPNHTPKHPIIHLKHPLIHQNTLSYTHIWLIHSIKHSNNNTTTHTPLIQLSTYMYHNNLHTFTIIYIKNSQNIS